MAVATMPPSAFVLIGVMMRGVRAGSESGAMETPTTSPPLPSCVVMGTITGFSGALVISRLEVLTEGSSRVLSEALGSANWVEVTVGRGLTGLPEASTVRRVVLWMVGPGGVMTVVTLERVEVLEALDFSSAALLKMSTIFEASTLVMLDEVLVVEVELEVEVVVDSMPVVGDSMTGACGMKKFGEMLIGWALQSHPGTTAVVGKSLDGMLLTKPMTVYANKAAVSKRKIARRAQNTALGT